MSFAAAANQKREDDMGTQERPHSKIISGSTALRRINCYASARLEARHPDTKSEAASRGTRLHALLEGLLRENKEPATGVEVAGDTITELDREPLDNALWALDGLAKGDSYEMFAELQGDVGDWAPGQGGTLDAMLLDGEDLYFVDFKFGWQPVHAKENVQLGFYSLCARNHPNEKVQSMLSRAKRTHFVIIQPPRMEAEADVWEVPDGWLEDLEVSLKAGYEGNLKGDAPPTPGRWCQFCKARAACPAVHEELQAIADIDPKAISSVELAALRKKWELYKSGYERIYAELQHRLEEGHDVPGLKLVEKRASRRWADVEAATRAVVAALGEKAWKKELLSPPQVEKKLGKKVFEASPEILEHVTKESTGYTIADASDRRPAVNVSAEAVRSAVEDLSGLSLHGQDN